MLITFFIYAWRWLIPLGLRIPPSGNLPDVTYFRALMVEYPIRGILLNVKEQIGLEWKDIYMDNENELFLPGLVFVFCIQVCVTKDDIARIVKIDPQFNPKLLRNLYIAFQKMINYNA